MPAKSAPDGAGCSNRPAVEVGQGYANCRQEQRSKAPPFTGIVGHGVEQELVVVNYWNDSAGHSGFVYGCVDISKSALLAGRAMWVPVEDVPNLVSQRITRCLIPEDHVYVPQRWSSSTRHS